MSEAVKKEDILKIAAPAVTMTGRVPTDITWRFTPTDVKKDIILILSPCFDNLTTDDVGIFPMRDGAIVKVGAMVKVPKDSKHLVNKKMQDLIVSNTAPDASNELKELMDKFCPKNAKKLIPDQDKRYYDIPIDLERVYRVIMDESGEYSKRTCGNPNAIKCNLGIAVLCDKNEPNRIKLIEIIKSTKSLNRKEPKPTKNLNW